MLFKATFSFTQDQSFFFFLLQWIFTLAGFSPTESSVREGSSSHCELRPLEEGEPLPRTGPPRPAPRSGCRPAAQGAGVLCRSERPCGHRLGHVGGEPLSETFGRTWKWLHKWRVTLIVYDIAAQVPLTLSYDLTLLTQKLGSQRAVGCPGRSHTWLQRCGLRTSPPPQVSPATPLNTAGSTRHLTTKRLRCRGHVWKTSSFNLHVLGASFLE